MKWTPEADAELRRRWDAGEMGSTISKAMGRTRNAVISRAHQLNLGTDSRIVRDLHLPMKAVYFDAIAAGTKDEEYRLVTPFWRRRLSGRSYNRIVLTRGYPKGGGVEGTTRLTREWRGAQQRTITHEFFGPDPVEVFAIDVTGKLRA